MARRSRPPAGQPGADWTAVVLTGGSSTRLGRDKATTRLGAHTLLDHVLLGLGASAGRTVVVGPDPGGPAATPGRARPIFCREDPPGSGPAAAVVAALPHVTSPQLGLIATDMPFAAPLLGHLAYILAQHPECEAAVPTDDTGRCQPLCAVYRTDALRAMAEVRDWTGAPLRALIGSLATLEVPGPDPWRLRDVDTAADLAWAVAVQDFGSDPARPAPGDALAGGILHPDDERTIMDKTQTWVADAATALGIEGEIDTTVVLDVARDVAHGVERPAAPLTTYLLGVAVGMGQSPEDAAATLRALLAAHNG